MKTLIHPVNNKQQKVLKAWLRLLWVFAKREWFSVVIWSALGALGAGFCRLFLLDRLFKAFAIATYLPSDKHFDDTRLYLPYTFAIGLALLVMATTYIVGIIPRGFRSWIEGVASGLCLLSFTSMFLVLTLHHGTIQTQLLTDLVIVAVWSLVGYLLHLRARVHAERTLNEADLLVPLGSRSLVGTELSESDDPIQSWREDALGRASLVDSVSIKLIVAKIPVLAICGEFGSGKTSILNLLREHLGNKAIVVSFSTWLPGSQETLTSYLFNDIANECQKQYVVPGMSKIARRLASALSQTVPFLRGYPELFPAGTQRDDIEAMNTALARIPKRVIVLLDELDRMEKEELVTLLKVIRGISSLRNLSFVCAADRTVIITTVKEGVTEESLRYFEKFFPVSVQVPRPDADALRSAGVERLVGAFNRRSWFENESEAEEFRKQIDKLWKERIAPFCPNLRAIGLLSNDTSAAAALLMREVHPVDLTLVELLRRFRPLVYDIVGKNSLLLTGGESWTRGGSYYSDEETKQLKERFLGDLRKATNNNEDELAQVRGILSELFPEFEKISGHRSLVSRSRRQGSKNDEKRIYRPGIFPAYFRYELPNSLFSWVELEAFVRRINSAATEEDRERIFLEKLNSMEKGSPKRDDFLNKLSDVVKSMPLPVTHDLVHAAMRAAHKYVYDSFLIGLGESGHVLRIVIGAAKRTPMSERANLLSRCIVEAGDDTMALHILTKLTEKRSDLDLGVSEEVLYPSFAQRMRSRYGSDVDATNVDLSSGDPQAFNLWSNRDPKDREVQRDFWLRYIGESRARLAQVFQGIFMPIGLYPTDPTPFVENKISVQDLMRLYETLPEAAITDLERKSLHRLKRFLDGEFKNGIDFGNLDDHEENQDQEEP